METTSSTDVARAVTASLKGRATKAVAPATGGAEPELEQIVRTAVAAVLYALRALDLPTKALVSKGDLQNFDGDGGGELTIEDRDIGKVDGNGTWILWGVGQDLVIHDKKDGRGSLTLKNFGKVTIVNKKDGDGTLIVEDCAAIEIAQVNGAGPTYLRLSGTKRIGLKDGDGNVYFHGAPPIIGTKNGRGQVVREQ